VADAGRGATVRQRREVLRLKFVDSVSTREITRIGAAVPTVRAMPKRIKGDSLNWPPPEEVGVRIFHITSNATLSCMAKMSVSCFVKLRNQHFYTTLRVGLMFPPDNSVRMTF
jgi:hypothetical protein